MQLVEILAASQVALYALGFGGLVYWLKGAVEAQQKTIAAQGEILARYDGLLKATESLRHSADEAKMLDRLKAYKEFVDREKDAAIKEQANRFQEEKLKMTDQQAGILKDLALTASGLTVLAGRLLPYVPLELRRNFIESNVSEPVIKESLYRMAHTAPDLSSVHVTSEERLEAIRSDLAALRYAWPDFSPEDAAAQRELLEEMKQSGRNQ